MPRVNMTLLRFLRAGTVATLYCLCTERISCISWGRIHCNAFVGGPLLKLTVGRKLTRGSRTASIAAPTTAEVRKSTAASFYLTEPHAGGFVWRPDGRNIRTAAGSGQEVRRRDASTGSRGGASMLGIELHPPDWDTIVGAVGQAVVLGVIGGGLIPIWTRQRIREKEAGLDADEGYEMGWDDDDDDLGFGDEYRDGYVCATCDNSNEVECTKCSGKGFFVSESAMPRKCGFCGGLGTLECPECEERREKLREERARRRPRLRLPPGKDEDFPFTR